MHFFSTNNLKHNLPNNPVLVEFIKLIEVYYLCCKGLNTPPCTQTIAKVFEEYEKLSGKVVSEQLKELVRAEANDKLNGRIPEELNKVIFASYTAKPLSHELLEFHKHTYDIHLVFRNHETYIFSLQPISEDKYFQEYNSLIDTQIVSGLSHVKDISLDPNEGVIIPPQVCHFSNFVAQNTTADQECKKCVVKIDQRYAKILQLE